LARRIGERFPAAGLAALGQELVRIAGDSVARVHELRRPNLALRGGIGVLLAGLIAILLIVLPELRLSWQVRAGKS
jgi:hypothetical protein